MVEKTTCTLCWFNSLLFFLVMCWLRPEARGQAKPGLRFLKAKAAGLRPGFCNIYLLAFYAFKETNFVKFLSLFKCCVTVPSHIHHRCITNHDNAPLTTNPSPLQCHHTGFLIPHLSQVTTHHLITLTIVASGKLEIAYFLLNLS